MKAIRVTVEEIEEGKPNRFLFQEFSEVRDGRLNFAARRMLSRAIERLSDSKQVQPMCSTSSPSLSQR